MTKKEARRLKTGTVVLWNEGSSRGLPNAWGRLRHVTPAGGCLVEPFSRHWSEGEPEPDGVEALLSRNWNDVGLPERWIPAAWIYSAS